MRKASFSGSAGVLRKGYRCKIHRDVTTMHSHPPQLSQDTGGEAPESAGRESGAALSVKPFGSPERAYQSGIASWKPAMANDVGVASKALWD